MALSTGKRIASGICFGRKVSSTVPRESNRDDVRFQNCNRLGCSIKHIILKGAEIDPEERPPPPPQKPQAKMGLKKLKERKKVVSLPQRESPDGDPEPRTPEQNEEGQDGPTVENSGGVSSSPTGDHRKRIARNSKYGNRSSSSSSSSSKSSSISGSSPRPGRLSEGLHANATGSSPPLTVDKKIVPSQTRCPPCRAVGGARPSNPPARSRTTPSMSSFPRPHPIPHAAPSVREGRVNSREAASRIYRFGMEEELAASLFGGASLEANSGGASQSIDGYGGSGGDAHDWSNPFVFSEALYELTGLTWGSELPLEVVAFEAAMLERRSWRDEHRDMRLDIDDMTYEELLALGENIGTVSTALTEEALSKCIKRIIYKPQTATMEAGSCRADDSKCSICQEEYVEGDEVGKLLCHHLYHMGCIRQWFRLKNWCPICKSAAAPPP